MPGLLRAIATREMLPKSQVAIASRPVLPIAKLLRAIARDRLLLKRRLLKAIAMGAVLPMGSVLKYEQGRVTDCESSCVTEGQVA